MAFLVGIKDERPTRARIAAALKRSERTVKRAIAELVEIGWITCEGGGNGTPAKLRILSFEEWILARDAKMAPDMAPVSPKMAPVRLAYKSVGINITPTPRMKPPQREARCLTAAEMWPEQPRRTG